MLAARAAASGDGPAELPLFRRSGPGPSLTPGPCRASTLAGEGPNGGSGGLEGQKSTDRSATGSTTRHPFLTLVSAGSLIV